MGLSAILIGCSKSSTMASVHWPTLSAAPHACCRAREIGSRVFLYCATASLGVRSAVIDGEIVCLDRQGRTQFNQLLYRRGDPRFYAFDLLFLNGRDLRKLALIERKARLRKIIPPQPSRVR